MILSVYFIPNPTS